MVVKATINEEFGHMQNRLFLLNGPCQPLVACYASGDLFGVHKVSK